jgi:hypothetical protein
MKTVDRVSPDSIYLTLTDQQVLSGCSLQVRQPVFTAGTGEAEASYPLFAVDGRRIEGRSAFYYDQDRGVFVDVEPSSFDPGRVNFKVHFSVPRIASGGHNYHGTDHRGTQQAMSDVESYLRNEVGIATDIKASRLSRLDSFINVEAENSFASYRPILSMLKGARMEEREYPDGFLWKNTQWQVAVYSKCAEMLAKKQKPTGVPKNAIRFERRMLNSRKIKTASGLETVKDLLDGFDVLRPDFDKAMRTALFKTQPKSTPALTVEEAEAGMLHFKDQGGQWMEGWLRAFAMSQIADIADIRIVTQAVENVAGNRMASTRMRRKLEQLHLDVSMLKTVSPGRQTLGDLYFELRTKVLNEPLRLVA